MPLRTPCTWSLLAVRAAGAHHAVRFHLPVRAGGALHAAVFQLAVGAGAAHRALAFHPAVGAGVAVRTVAFQPAVLAGFALLAAVFWPAVGAGAALRAVEFPSVGAPLLSGHHESAFARSNHVRAHYVCAPCATTCAREEREEQVVAFHSFPENQKNSDEKHRT